jgi:hypothetical protein
LDCLRRQAKQVAQRGLTAGEADGFGDSGFHGCNLKFVYNPRLHQPTTFYNQFLQCILQP